MTNTGTKPATQVDIKAVLPKELKAIEKGTKGATPAAIADQVVTFGRVESLAPQQRIEFVVEAQALAAGDVRFQVEMRSASLQSPVVETEATRLIDPGAR